MFQEECLSHMSRNGLPFDGPLIANGEIHRYSADSKPSKKDEWYCAHAGITAKGSSYFYCIYGSWSDGSKIEFKSWESTSSVESRLSHAELQALQKKAEKRQRDLKEKQNKKHVEAAQKAEEIWRCGVKEGTHPYLIKKQIEGLNIRFGQFSGKKAAILVPLRDVEGNLRSIQFIFLDKRDSFCKRFLYGGEKSGNFHTIGKLDIEEFVAVCEGYATGVSWHMATGMPTVVAFDAGNLKTVVSSLRKKYQSLPILILGDDDIGSEINFNIPGC